MTGSGEHPGACEKNTKQTKAGKLFLFPFRVHNAFIVFHRMELCCFVCLEYSLFPVPFNRVPVTIGTFCFALSATSRAEHRLNAGSHWRGH